MNFGLEVYLRLCNNTFLAVGLPAAAAVLLIRLWANSLEHTSAYQTSPSNPVTLLRGMKQGVLEVSVRPHYLAHPPFERRGDRFLSLVIWLLDNIRIPSITVTKLASAIHRLCALFETTKIKEYAGPLRTRLGRAVAQVSATQGISTSRSSSTV